MLANMKRKKLTRHLHSSGFASSDAVLNGKCIAMLPESSDFWIGLKDIVGSMLTKDPSLRPTAQFLSSRLAEISVAASFAVHCCCVDELNSPPRSQHDEDSDSSEDGEPYI